MSARSRSSSAVALGERPPPRLARPALPALRRSVRAARCLLRRRGGVPRRDLGEIRLRRRGASLRPDAAGWVFIARLYGLYSQDDQPHVPRHRPTRRPASSTWSRSAPGSSSCSAWLTGVAHPAVTQAPPLLGARGALRARWPRARPRDVPAPGQRSSRTRSSSAPATSGSSSRRSCYSTPSTASTSSGFVDSDAEAAGAGHRGPAGTRPARAPGGDHPGLRHRTGDHRLLAGPHDRARL